MNPVICVIFGFGEAKPLAFVTNNEAELEKHEIIVGHNLNVQWNVNSQLRFFYNATECRDTTKTNLLLLKHAPAWARRVYGTVVVALLPKPESHRLLESTILEIADNILNRTDAEPDQTEMNLFVSRFEFAETKDAPFAVALCNLEEKDALEYVASKGYKAHVGFSHGVDQERMVFVSKA